MRYDIQKINKLDILEVAKDLGMDIKKRNVTYMTKCCFHNDSNPSMQLIPADKSKTKLGQAKCYSCGKSTNVLGLIEAYLNTNFHGAIEWLKNNSLLPLTPPPGEGRGVDLYQTGYKTRRKEALLAKPKRIRINFETEGSDPLVQKLMRNEEFYVFPSDFLDDKITMKDSFSRCLIELVGYERALEVVRMYRLGAYPASGRYPDVMFPCIDRYGRIRDIKLQSYDCDPRSDRFCHRGKQCSWLGPQLWAGFDKLTNRPYTFNRDCFFGEHLLNRRFQGVSNSAKEFQKEKPVALVESPKNACLGAAIMPDFIWLAAGNKGMLKIDMLRRLKGRTVVVLPDTDAYDEWNKIIKSIPGEKFICTHPMPPRGQLTCPEKWDIGDKIVEGLTPLSPSPKGRGQQM